MGIASIIRTNRFFDGETEEEKTEREESERIAEEEKKKAKPQDATGRRYTQDEVNRMMKGDKDKAKVERDRLIQELQVMKEQGLTTDNMEVLQNRIDQLANENKTKEEQTKEALEKKDKEYAKQLGIKESEAKKWRQDYEKFRAESEILAAGNHYKADNPGQIYKLLKSDVTYVEKLDGSGKGTGEWVPKIKMEITKDGETKELLLSPMEALKQMTEMEEHHNLFNSGASSGIGGNNNGGNRSGATTVPRDMNGYMKARKANPRLHANTGKDTK